MDLRIAIAVSDVDLSVWGDGGSRRMVERRFPLRGVPFADPQEWLALKGEDNNLMRVAVSDPDAVEAVNRNAVGIEDLALPVAANERALRIKDEHGRLPASQHMRVSQRIDCHLADARRRDVGRRPAEIASDGVGPAS